MGVNDMTNPRSIIPKLIFFLLFLLGSVATQALASTGARTFTQPGAEAFTANPWQWLEERGWETEEGYTVLFDELHGKWVYGTKGNAGLLVPTSLVVGESDPAGLLTKHLRPTITQKSKEIESRSKIESPQPTRTLSTETLPACLGAAGGINGTVRDADGNPISGARIQIRRWTGRYYSSGASWSTNFWYAYSDASGQYSITAEPGFYQVTASGSGYGPQVYDGDVAVISSTFQMADFILPAEATISGTVTDESGNPLLNGSVNAYQYNGNYWDWKASDEFSNGTYTIDSLGEGTYQLQFDSYDNYIDEYYNNATSLGAGTDISVVSGQQVTGINAQLALGGGIEGQVLNPNGEYDVYGNAYLYDANTGDESSYIAQTWFSGYGNSTSGSPAAFSFKGIAVGTYYVRIVNYSGYTNEYYNNTSTLASATPISVTIGNTTTLSDIQLVGSGARASAVSGPFISGTVTDESGTPLQDVDVYAYLWNGQYYEWVGAYGYTDSLGQYSITGLTAGTYQVYFRKSGFKPEYYDNSYNYSITTDVIVPDTGISGINAALYQYTSSISGKIVDSATNIPLSYIWIQPRILDINQNWSWFDGTSTNECGNYSIDVDTGTYRVRAEDSEQKWGPQFYPSANSLLSATDITVPADSAINSIDLALSPAGGISGTVTDWLGVPLPDVNVDIYQKIGEWDYWHMWGGHTDQNGNYQAEGLNGDYYVNFYLSGYNAVTFPDGDSLSTGVPVSVSSGTVTPNIDASLISHTTTCVTGAGTLSGPYSGENIYSATGNITSSGSATIDNGSSLEARSPFMITLLPGFHAENGSYFRAEITAVSCQ